MASWAQPANSLEELLDRSHGEGLDDGPRRLGLDHADLAEHLSLAGLRRRLHAGLDHAHAGQGDLARLLDFLLDDLCQASEDLQDIRLLQLRRRRHGHEVVRDDLRLRPLGVWIYGGMDF